MLKRAMVEGVEHPILNSKFTEHPGWHFQAFVQRRANEVSGFMALCAPDGETWKVFDIPDQNAGLEACHTVVALAASQGYEPPEAEALVGVLQPAFFTDEIAAFRRELAIPRSASEPPEPLSSDRAGWLLFIDDHDAPAGNWPGLSDAQRDAYRKQAEAAVTKSGLPYLYFVALHDDATPPMVHAALVEALKLSPQEAREQGNLIQRLLAERADAAEKTVRKLTAT